MHDQQLTVESDCTVANPVAVKVEPEEEETVQQNVQEPEAQLTRVLFKLQHESLLSLPVPQSICKTVIHGLDLPFS